LWPAEGAVVPDLSGTERNVAMIRDGAGGVFVSFATSSSLRGQRLNEAGEAQWRSGGSNGLSLMQGDEPQIGTFGSNVVVVYRRVFGVSARIIEVPEPEVFGIAHAAFLSSSEFGLTLQGGTPGIAYDVLRATTLGAPLSDAAWTVVGSIETGETWVDTAPPDAAAFYVVGEATDAN
jgi:hypothetical protein